MCDGICVQYGAESNVSYHSSGLSSAQDHRPYAPEAEHQVSVILLTQRGKKNLRIVTVTCDKMDQWDISFF